MSPEPYELLPSPEPYELLPSPEPYELLPSPEPYERVLPKLDPSPLFRLYEEDPGSEYEGILLFTPPLDEQVPRPEFEEYVPLLQ